MFDIGFSELLLFGVIALIVLGPEKLPQAARTAGQWYAKIRRTVSTLQSEIEAELDLAETRQLMQKELAKIRQTEADMRREMAEIRGNMKEFEHSQNQHIKASHTSGNNSENYQNDTANNATINGDKANDETGTANQPVMPKPFDYEYEQTEQSAALDHASAQNSNDGLTTGANEQALQTSQPMITKPWENMWFRLGAYDKARRLPMPPYLPDYKADVLLNAPVTHSLEKPALINKQEAD